MKPFLQFFQTTQLHSGLENPYDDSLLIPVAQLIFDLSSDSLLISVIQLIFDQLAVIPNLVKTSRLGKLMTTVY